MLNSSVWKDLKSKHTKGYKTIIRKEEEEEVETKPYNENGLFSSHKMLTTIGRR